MLPSGERELPDIEPWKAVVIEVFSVAASLRMVECQILRKF